MKDMLKPQVVNRSLSISALLFLAVVLVACGGGATAPSDTDNPLVQISSGDSSTTASFELTGIAVDDVEVTDLEYTLAGGTPVAMTLTGNTFSANLTLAPGTNEITVTASDAAGNQGSDTATVEYLAPPSGATSSLAIAARGESIVISGSNFGAAGEVRIGDLIVGTDSWSTDQIELTLPHDAPGGPQTVVVSSPYGDSSFELFVGVAFEPGPLDDLVAEGHPKGTAVQLLEGEYTQVAAALDLDNLSFYGQGVDLTTINTGGIPNSINYFADSSEQLVLADLTLIADAVFVAPSAPGPIAPLGTASIDPADTAAATAKLNEVIETNIELYGSGDVLEAQSGVTGSLTLRNLKIEQLVGGLGFVTASIGSSALTPYSGSVHVENVEFDAVDSIFGLLTGGDITVMASQVDSAGFVLLSLNGGIEIADSELSGSAAGGSLGGLAVVYSDSLTISGSEFRSYSQMMQIAPISMLFGGGSGLPGSAPVTITDSTFRTFDSDPAVTPVEGELFIVASGAESHVSGNTFRAHGGVGFASIGGSLGVYDNSFTLGHASIANTALMLQAMDFASYLEFTGNTATWLSEGGVEASGNFEISVHDNSFTGNGSGTAISIDQTSGEWLNAYILDNDFIAFESALSISLPGAGSDPFELTMTGNHFDFPINAAGKVAELTNVVEASLDVDGNIWGEEDDVPTLNGFITELGTTTPGIMTINSVLTP